MSIAVIRTFTMVSIIDNAEYIGKETEEYNTNSIAQKLQEYTSFALKQTKVKHTTHIIIEHTPKEDENGSI